MTDPTSYRCNCGTISGNAERREGNQHDADNPSDADCDDRPLEPVGPLVSVGKVHSPWTDPRDIPLEGGCGHVEIFAPFASALEGIERTSHVVLITYLHQADRTVMQTGSKKFKQNAKVCGVFASRSPSRPNPIGLTVARIQKREALRLYVSPIDLVCNTPLLDIKSYSPGWDSVFCATSARRVSSHHLPEELLASFLQRDIDNFVGDKATSEQAHRALRAVIKAVKQYQIDPRDKRLHVIVSGCNTTMEALMAMTGASFSNGRLHLDTGILPDASRFVVQP